LDFIEKITSTPAITAAVITGAIAFLGLIIQLTTFFVKFKYESKTSFEQIIQDKIGKIYFPLLLELNNAQDACPIINDKIRDIISNYSHLLSVHLLTDIMELFKTEQYSENNMLKPDFIEEHKNLKAKILLQTKKDFDELQYMYNKYFIKKKNKLYTPWYKKVFWRVVKFFALITITFYIFLFSLLAFSKVPKSFQSSFTDFIMFILVFITMVTTVIGIGTGLGYILNRVSDRCRKIKKYYMSGEYVTKSGKYYCRICYTPYYLSSNTRFRRCTKHTLMQDLKSISKFYDWAKCDEKYYKKMGLLKDDTNNINNSKQSDKHISV